MFITIEAIEIISILIMSIVIHENAHARVAFYLGDSTAKDMGRFSFNPLKHMNIFSILLPLALYFMNTPMLSFAEPVLYTASSFKHPKRDIILVGLAGPLANIILAIIAYILYNKLSMLPEDIFFQCNKSLLNIFYINIVLCAFNLLPIPPLDGSSLYMSSIYHKQILTNKINYFGTLILINLVIIIPAMAGEKYSFIRVYMGWFFSHLFKILEAFGI